MNHGRTVFSQLISFLPDREFRRCVERYQGDIRLRGFSCWDQYLAMAFAQLTYRESVHDIEACRRSMQGQPDAIVSSAGQQCVQDLPEETLVFLRGSRYCETDLLSDTAWELFSGTTPGHIRVQAIYDYVYNHIASNYLNACATRGAVGAFNGRTSVCRDYAHLAVAFCRCMNIPARYCTGYLSDVGTPPPFAVGDFAAWVEAWIGGRWHIFDPRNNVPRLGRVLMARGRDASDVAIATTFGPSTLESFRVWTDEIPDGEILRTAS